MKNEKIKVYLADDHAILREGLKLILTSQKNCEIIGESGDGKEALEEIERLKPELVILDISMPTMTGIEVARKIRRYYPSMKIIVLSRHDNEEYVKQLLKYGIHGYVLKDDAGNDLIRAVDAVFKDQVYLSPRITNHLVNDFQILKKREQKTSREETIQSFDVLTNREREIVKLIAEGKSNDEIGHSLWISPRTVKVHRANIMRKLNLHKVTDVVKYALKAGIIES
ncbi:MAG: response regulator transcription factor [Leptospiraceae bacterium]|nr:response regulator transcription factor [Leptospiraceae bacterium]